MNFIIENFKKPKTILIILGLTAVVVFSVMLIGYESYLNTLIVGSEICGDGIDNDGDGLVDEGCGTTATCNDSDGGKNIYVKGTATDDDESQTDSCSSSTRLLERWCRDGKWVEGYYVNCPSGYKCQNGRCTKMAQCYTDADCQSGYKCQNGRCVKQTSPEVCDGRDNDGDGLIDEGNLCQSGYKCQNGRCVKIEIEPKCEADGKCKYPGCPNGDPDCLCSQQSGNICQTNETCPGISLAHNYIEGQTCCSVVCTPAAIYSISGQIINSENISVSGITINLTGTFSASTATNSDGNYSFINLASGSYIITPSDDIWTFSPTSQNATISNSNVSEINFTATPDLCKQDFEVQDENSAPIAGAEVFVQGAFLEISGEPACNTDNNGCCYIELRRIEKNHIAEAQKDGYECYNNECQRTFDGCLAEAIVLKLKKPADFQTADLDCDGIVGGGDIAIVLKWWDKDPSGFTCCQTPDIDGDGTANAGDYAIVLKQWTFGTF